MRHQRVHGAPYNRGLKADENKCYKLGLENLIPICGNIAHKIVTGDQLDEEQIKAALRIEEICMGCPFFNKHTCALRRNVMKIMVYLAEEENNIEDPVDKSN